MGSQFTHAFSLPHLSRRYNCVRLSVSFPPSIAPSPYPKDANPANATFGNSFQSHIPTHAHPLLSLLLYVSPQNYSHATRPAYTPLLPWPAQYIIPPQRRAAAQTRCEHLGVQGVEFDDDEKDDAEGKRPRFGAGMLADALSGTTTAPNKKNTTVTSALQTHISHPRSRLSPTIDALCIPLTTFLSNNSKNSPTTNPSTASCLALAYLSLLLIPSLPISWLQHSIRERYPTLASFVERGVSDIYGGETNVGEALDGRMKGEGDLPWRKPEIVGAKMAERMIWGSVLDQLPGSFGRNIVHQGRQEPKNDNEQKDGLARTSLASIPPALAITTAVAAAVAGYLAYTSAAVDKNLDKAKKLSDMGEAGALFANLDFSGAISDGEARARVVPVGLEVDVSSDGEI